MDKFINPKLLKSFSESTDILLRPIVINQSNVKVYIFAVDGLINTQ